MTADQVVGTASAITLADAILLCGFYITPHVEAGWNFWEALNAYNYWHFHLYTAATLASIWRCCRARRIVDKATVLTGAKSKLRYRPNLKPCGNEHFPDNTCTLGSNTYMYLFFYFYITEYPNIFSPHIPLLIYDLGFFQVGSPIQSHQPHDGWNSVLPCHSCFIFGF